MHPAVADPKGAPGTHLPLGPNSFIFTVFGKRFVKQYIGELPSGVVHPPAPREILDPPLLCLILNQSFPQTFSTNRHSNQGLYSYASVTRRRAHHTQTTYLPRVPPRRGVARVRTRRVTSAELTSCGMSRAPCVCGPPRRAAPGGSAPAAASAASSLPSQTFSVAK